MQTVGKGGVVARVHQLEEFLARPLAGGGGVDVIEDEEGRGPDLLEERIEAGVAFGRLVGGAQAVQQVGGEHEEHRLAAGDALVGDSGGEVGLAGAAGALQDEPAVGFVRVGTGPARMRRSRRPQGPRR